MLMGVVWLMNYCTGVTMSEIPLRGTFPWTRTRVCRWFNDLWGSVVQFIAVYRVFMGILSGGICSDLSGVDLSGV